MSLLIYSDEHGWLKGWTRGFGRETPGANANVEPTWSRALRDAYVFQSLREAQQLNLANATIVEVKT